MFADSKCCGISINSEKTSMSGSRYTAMFEPASRRYFNASGFSAVESSVTS